jgi:hypothetical protein
MLDQMMEPVRADEYLTEPPVMPDWRPAFRAELDRAIVRGGGRWSRAFFAVALIHLVAFLVCHVLHSPSRVGDPRHILVWCIELVTVFVAMRLTAGKGWFWSPEAIHFVGRLWLTLLILSFSLSTLNATIGWETLWFKAAWGTLSSFFFATLAWLITPRFLLVAVQMYVTALLMARFPEWNNLIYGASWWLALSGIALMVRRREREIRDQREDDADPLMA